MLSRLVCHIYKSIIILLCHSCSFITVLCLIKLCCIYKRLVLFVVFYLVDDFIAVDVSDLFVVCDNVCII